MSTSICWCRWYALCDRPAEGTTPHPVLGDVPICARCADKHALPINLFLPASPDAGTTPKKENQ